MPVLHPGSFALGPDSMAQKALLQQPLQALHALIITIITFAYAGLTTSVEGLWAGKADTSQHAGLFLMLWSAILSLKSLKFAVTGRGMFALPLSALSKLSRLSKQKVLDYRVLKQVCC